MLSDLKNCKTIYDLCLLLDIPAKHLSYLLYILPETSRYTSACLSKKSGGTRQILIPNKRLKILQRRLSEVLYLCLEDIDKTNGQRRSFGFEKGRTIYDNAAQHVGKRWVFNVDLEDFFPSINFGRVIGYFKNNKHFCLEPRIATLIAQIACHSNQLPQGAPSSPVIANLICGSLDFRLSKFAKKARCNYSRYADDITFSTNQRNFPERIAVPDKTEQGWAPSAELDARIKDAGFQIKVGKTRMSYQRSRQMVTGLVVNEKPNVPREHYRNLRAAIHRMMRGKDWHLPRRYENFAWNCEGSATQIDEFAAVESRIAFIYKIADQSDPRKSDARFFQPSSVGRTYGDLLNLKYFVRGSRPIILTEGISDVLYLKGAALDAKTDIPGFSKFNPLEDNDILVDFYNSPESASRVLGLTGGTGKLGLFLERYKRFLSKLSTNVPRRPFIILVDNDTGLDGIESVVKKNFGVDISRNANDPFFKIADSTYVVKTPHKGPKKKTSSEDFLDPRALKKDLGGKTFSSKPKYDNTKHYGKSILGSHILQNLDQYSFSNFKPVLDRICGAISDATK